MPAVYLIFNVWQQQITAKDSSTEYGATNSLYMDEPEHIQFYEFSWKIEEYQRGIKQFCMIERSQFRTEPYCTGQ